MKKIIFNKNTSLSEKTHRFLLGISWQAPWFCLFSLTIWYAKIHTASFLEHAFELWQEKKSAFLLQQQTQDIEEELSLVNPLKLTDYIASLTASTFATAKVSALEQTVHFLSFLFEDLLIFIWFISIFYVFIRTYRYYRKKTVENDIANLVIEKLLPLLEQMNKDNQTKLK